MAMLASSIMTTTESVILDYPPVTLGDKARSFTSRFPYHARNYLSSFFPIFQWIARYNGNWMIQDAIAGVTVGMVLVPQGIAYAKIANLAPQYGLYTSFVGSCLYCLFGTSKDISIGPITVVSLLVGHTIMQVTSAHPDITGPEVAAYLSFIVGIIAMLMGMLRLGVLVDFIPAPVIAGYMTSSAITISVGQWGKLTGIPLDTHQAPYLIVGDLLSSLSKMTVDVAFGLTALLALYGIKYFAVRAARRLPRFERTLFYIGIMRSGLVVVIGTFVSFLINLNGSPSSSPFKILKSVPPGFDAAGVPRMNLAIMEQVVSVLPSTVVIMVLEHISVAKSFGRLSDYSINADQEVLAIGISNLVGSFFGAYPGTGAFSRTAIMARSGAKTPLSSFFSALILLLALYILTPAFYYIPEAILAAVVIHAVTDLVSGPSYLKELWRTSKLDLFIFGSAVLITCLDNVEMGIYVAVALSLFVTLMKLARPAVTVLGRSPLGTPCRPTTSSKDCIYNPSSSQHYIYVDENDPHFSQRLEPLPPGVVIFHIGNALLYPNAAYVSECIIAAAKARTRCNNSQRETDPLWNEPQHHSQRHLPVLEAVILDCSAVNWIDSTAMEALANTREILDRYAGHRIEWHFARLVSHHLRSQLTVHGFGTLDSAEPQTCASTCHSETTQVAVVISEGDNNEKIEQEQGVASLSPPSRQNNNTDNRLSCLPVSPSPSPIGSDMIHPYYYMERDSKYAHYFPMLDPHASLPRDRFPCFHWDIDVAVRSICERWGSC